MKGRQKLRKESDKVEDLNFTVVIFSDSVLCVLEEVVLFIKSERDWIKINKPYAPYWIHALEF